MKNLISKLFVVLFVTFSLVIVSCNNEKVDETSPEAEVEEGFLKN
ncbi:MAG: hypothetical protein P8M66_08195 [Flavobacteriaceae bacterium]|nr:hypothetical protein [Flavobacteriaceae bacterium]MDG2499470.1 hypothetical protein [Flavobacteriaceae bacterium]